MQQTFLCLDRIGLVGAFTVSQFGCVDSGQAYPYSITEPQAVAVIYPFNSMQCSSDGNRACRLDGQQWACDQKKERRGSCHCRGLVYEFVWSALAPE